MSAREQVVTVYSTADFEPLRTPRRQSHSSPHDMSERYQPRPPLTYHRSQSQTSVSDAHHSLADSNASESDIIIMVMGMTGSGKSSFINLLSDRNVQVGHSLTSCTTEPEVYTVPFSRNRRAYLIDTPGFDDTSRGDEEILKGIAFLLHSFYQKGKRLAGLIYMHRITDVRMSGTAVKNLELFRKICGTSTFPHVALVSTMWQMLRGEEGLRTGEQREEALLAEPRFWKEFRDGGSRLMKHDGTERSAWSVFGRLPLSSRGVVVDLQKEMDRGLSLNETAAGLFLQNDLIQLKKKYETSLRQLQKEIEEARVEGDADGEDVLRDEHQATLSKIHRADAGVKALNVENEDLIHEKAPVYQENLRSQERKEIAQDAEVKGEVEEMRRLKDEIAYLRSREKESQSQLDVYRRRDQALSRAHHERRHDAHPQRPRSPSSQRLAKLEARYRKEEERIDRILLNKGSTIAWLKPIVDFGARYVYANIPNRPLRRASTDPSALSRHAE